MRSHVGKETTAMPLYRAPKRTMTRLLQAMLALGLVAGVVGAAFPSLAADTTPVNDPTLVAAAKREGSLTFYVAMQPNQAAEMEQRFEATYGIKLNFLRLNSDKIPARVMTELRGGRQEVDVVADTGFEIDQLKRQGVFTPLNLKEKDDLLAGTSDPEGYWYSIFLLSETIGYNPARVKALGLKPPSNWDDFGNKQWRGLFSVFGAGVEWYANLKQFYGKQRADEIVRAIGANDPRIISGHTLGISMAISGEVVGTVNTYGYDTLIEKDKGSSIELVNPNPTIIENFPIAILKTAPHPNAARLFVRWWLSHQTQVWMRDNLKRISARKDVKNDPRMFGPKIHYVVSNPAESANFAQDRAEFNDLLNIPN
jgi:iron(III) transport system substrate-binding protein